MLQASFGDLQSLRIKESFDLVVCADVLHYLDEAEIGRGLRAIVPLARGVLFFEVLTKEDDIVGDDNIQVQIGPFIPRAAAERSQDTHGQYALVGVVGCNDGLE